MVRSFPPAAGRSARVLVLGSMPGLASLRVRRYYAHPRNQFWRLLGHGLGEELAALPYSRRLARLRARGVAVWDVFAECRREGSLDSDIRDPRPNAVLDLIARLGVRRVLLNGGTAARAFKRLFSGELPAGVRAVQVPSSSPAAAAVPYARKAALWRAALARAQVL